MIDVKREKIMILCIKCVFMDWVMGVCIIFVVVVWFMVVGIINVCVYIV